MLALLSHFTAGTPSSALLLSLTIVLCALFMEDLTIVIVGLLAADGFISIPVAFLSLYVGIALADTALYGLGSLARTHPKLARYIEHDTTLPFRSWLGTRYAFTVFSGHFVPGLRVTTYIASGFFRCPLATYIPMAIAGGLFLLTTLFTLSYLFGSLTAQWLGPARWVIAALFLLVLFFIGRHNLLAYRAMKSEPSTSPRER